MMRCLFLLLTCNLILVTLSGGCAIGAPVETKPAATLPCFPGAYYRKAVSSLDQWTGIEAVIQLPDPTYDQSRLKPSGRPLDNASIYLGGNADEQEIDCGVNWEIIKETDGSVSTVGKAFRPFWRNNQWYSGPAKPEYYFYPGDVIRIRVENTADDKLLMRIDLLARANDADQLPEPATQVEETTPIVATKALSQAADNRLSTHPADAVSSFTTVFDAPGFRVDGLKQFKRVNGLDQSGNEGKAVQPTKTRIENAEWREVWLLRGNERIPMTPDRFTDMRCPDPKHIKVSPVGLSGEKVSLIGTPEN